jgi:hypothetical protein
MIPNAARVGDLPKSEPVPEGLYHIRADKAEYKTSGPNSKKPGSPMAEVQFTIFGPEEAEEYHGRKLFENFMLAGDGAFRIRQFLEATGEDENFVLEDTDQIIGRESGAVVQVEPPRPGPDGKQYDARNRIVKFLPLE